MIRKLLGLFLLCCSAAYGQSTGLPNNAPQLPSNLYTTNPASSSGSTSGGASLPTTNLLANCPLTDAVGTTIACGTAGTGTFGTGNAAPSQNVPLASDNCVGSVLGPNWTPLSGTIIETANTCQISVAGGGTFTGAMNTSATFSNDQYSQATNTSAAGTGAFGVGVRLASGGSVGQVNGYVCYNTTTTAFLAKMTNSAATVLNNGGSGTARTQASGDILRLQIVGSALTCTITTSGGVATVIGPITDATYTSGNPGIFGSAIFATSPSLANWFAGNTTAPAGGGLWFSGGQFVTLPASLNSAREWDVYLCYQRASNANAYNSIVQGNGNGAASNANGFGLSGQPNLSNGPIAQQLPHLSVLGGSNYNAMVPYSNFNGCGVATVVFGSSTDRTFDSTFINGNESIYTNNFKTQSAGLQTVGAPQLGGAAAGSGFATVSFLTGKVYAIASYSTPNDAPTRAQVVQALTQSVVNRGGPAPFLGDTARGDTCITSGDSITNGFGVTNGLVWTQNLSFFTPANGSTFNSGGTSCWNQGVTATTMKQLDVVFPWTDFPLFSTSARNVVVLFACTNDMIPLTATSPISYTGTAGQCIQSMKHYADQARVPNGLGVKVIVVSMLSRTTFDANKDAFNPVLRNWWASFADGFVDLGENLLIGADGTSAGAAFQDGIHPTADSQLNILSPRIERAINRIYGNNSFSEATTYGSAAAAAVATTAGTEATNTMTITMAATPANCQVGNIAVVAGTTPAGYSLASGRLILTRSATQVTLYNNTTGLGPITVQGTLVCPQLQDQDVYSIVNFGAGNFTLDTCDAYTGQNIYIRNINAVASTLVPFNTETITGGGATPTALTGGTTAILQSTLVSNTAGGCNWVRLQ